MPDEALERFLTHCSQNIGDAYFKTPRNTIKAFVDLLSVIEQNPSLDWRKLLQDVKPEVFVPEGNAIYSSETTVLNTPVGIKMFPDASTFVVYMYILNPGSTFVP